MARDEQTPPPARRNFAFVRPLGAEVTGEQIDEMADLLSRAIITGELPKGTHRTQHAEVLVGEVSPAFIAWHTSVQSSNAKAAARAAHESVTAIQELLVEGNPSRLSKGRRGALTRAIARARAAADSAEAAAEAASREFKSALASCNHPAGDDLRQRASSHHSRAWDAKEQAYEHKKAAAKALESVKRILSRP